MPSSRLGGGNEENPLFIKLHMNGLAPEQKVPTEVIVAILSYLPNPTRLLIRKDLRNELLNNRYFISKIQYTLTPIVTYKNGKTKYRVVTQFDAFELYTYPHITDYMIHKHFTQRYFKTELWGLWTPPYLNSSSQAVKILCESDIGKKNYLCVQEIPVYMPKFNTNKKRVRHLEAQHDVHRLRTRIQQRDMRHGRYPCKKIHRFNFFGNP